MYFQTLKWQKWLTIVGTGFFGAALSLVGADYFLNATRVSIYIHNCLMARMSMVSPCLYGWLIIGLWPVLSAVGILVQCRVTGRKYNHQQQISGLGINIIVISHLSLLTNLLLSGT